MKNWYQNRMKESVNHRGQNIPEGKKVYLTEAQAKVHNAQQEKVAKTDAPKEKKEVGVLADWNEWTKANPSSSLTKAEATESKGKSSTKAK